jgi:DNA-binding beta-propeller fold protein YncE
MKNSFYALSLLVILSCEQPEKEWIFSHKITLQEGVHPLGITRVKSSIWVSDPDNNRILQINENGEILKKIEDLQRPMHIEGSNGEIYIPAFGSDSIFSLLQDQLNFIPINEPMDAPSGISTLDGAMAIADFYNNRVLLLSDEGVKIIGEKGNKAGMFYYPTDIKLTKDWIFVADAYNNRIQLFNKEGIFERQIGRSEKIQVAIGIDVFENELFVADYYGSRVLIYDLNGPLLNSFSENLNKPTDVLVVDDRFYVTNYGENTISVFERR